MKLKKTIVFIFTLTTLFSCSQGDNKTSANSQTDTTATQKSTLPKDTTFATAWANFVKAINSSDSTALKALSTDCIHCGECLYNTDKESVAFQKLMDTTPNNSSGDSIINQLKYYPIDKFIKEDFSIVFQPAVKEQLNNAKNITINDNEVNRKLFTNSCFNTGIDNPKLKEVLVNFSGGTVSKDEQSEWAAVFAFIETKSGEYKFCGYSIVD